jgi:hypothetical protein
MIRVVCMLLVGWAFLPLRAQVPDTIIAWQPQWYVLEGGRLVQNPDWQREHTGFFEVPTFQQTHLFVSSRGPFTVWINQVFLGDYVDGLAGFVTQFGWNKSLDRASATRWFKRCSISAPHAKATCA